MSFSKQGFLRFAITILTLALAFPAFAAENAIDREIRQRLERQVPRLLEDPTVQNRSLAGYALAALATLAPDTALKIYWDIPRRMSGHKDREFTVEDSAWRLAVALPDMHRVKFVSACATADNPAIRRSVAMRIPIRSELEALTVGKLVDGTTPFGSFMYLLWADELRGSGQHHEKVLARAVWKDPGGDLGNQLTVDYDIENMDMRIARILRAFVEDDPGFRLSEAAALDAPDIFDKLYWRNPDDPRQAIRFAEWMLDRVDRDKPSLMRFYTFAYFCRFLKEKTPDRVADYVTSHWHVRDVGEIRWQYTNLHDAVFWAVNSLAEKRPKWSVRSAEEFAEALFARGDFQQRYHMIGRLCGVIAKNEPERAMNLVRRIKSDGWGLEARRCVVHSMAGVSLEKALAIADEYERPMGSDAVRADLRLEAAIASARRDPSAALAELRKLPDEPGRAMGLSFIAPAIAADNPALALELSSGDTQEIMVIALSKIAHDRAGVPSQLSRTQEYSPSLVELVARRDDFPPPDLPPFVRFQSEYAGDRRRSESEAREVIARHGAVAFMPVGEDPISANALYSKESHFQLIDPRKLRQVSPRWGEVVTYTDSIAFVMHWDGAVPANLYAATGGFITPQRVQGNWTPPPNGRKILTETFVYYLQPPKIDGWWLITLIAVPPDTTTESLAFTLLGVRIFVEDLRADQFSQYIRDGVVTMIDDEKSSASGAKGGSSLEAMDEPASVGDSYFRMAVDHQKNNDHERAIECFDKAIQLGWNHGSVYGLRGQAKLELGQYVGAIKDFDKAVQLEPEWSVAHFVRGRAYERLGQNERALEDFDAAIRLDPVDADAYVCRAIVHWKLGHFEMAAGDAEHGVNLDTSLAVRRVLFAAIASRRIGAGDSAARLLDRVAAAGARDTWPYPVVRYLRAEIDAKELLRMADTKDKRTEARAYLGLDLAIKGRRAEAEEHFCWVRDSGNRNLFEYELAIMELARPRK